MKILIIYPSLTHPIDAGNKQWVMYQVQELRRLGQDVFMLCLNIPRLKADSKNNKREKLQTEEYWGRHGFIYNASWLLRVKYFFFNRLRKRFFGGYYKCDDLYPNGLTLYVKKLQKSYNFDICIVNYYWLSKLFNSIDFPKTAINTHDVFAERDKVLGVKNPWMCTTRQEEAKGIQRAQSAFTLQDDDYAYIKSIAPRINVYNVYCPYKIEKLLFCGNHNLVVLAAGGDLNLDGMIWFIDEIFPSILNKIPDVRLVVGGGICQLLKNYTNHPNIQLIGKVEHPRDLYKLGDVSINPCRKGTGLKVKTFEALSYGRVCMAHPHSIIGIFNRQDNPIFVSEIADEWADFLYSIWSSSKIDDLANKSIEYISMMNKHIERQYQNFLKKNI